MAAEFEIAGRKIGSSFPPYLIAELSGNHNGDLSRAMRLIECAAKSGADAVKIQTYRPDTITLDYDGPGFVVEDGPWRGRSLYELYEEAHTPWEWHKPLFAKARAVGITLFSSPFDMSAVEMLEELGAPAYKIASFEAVDTNLIRRVAETGKPIIISTGLASMSEIQEALAAAKCSGGEQLALLHCVSAYPAPAMDANLASISLLRASFELEVGLSDHTLGITVAVASVALGASIVEKHLTLSRKDGGPDAGFSIEPAEFLELRTQATIAWQAIGTGNPGPPPSEESNRIFRRSLYIVEDIKAGDTLTERNVKSIRPGLGLPPKYLGDVLGLTARADVSRGTPLSWDLVVGT